MLYRTDTHAAPTRVHRQFRRTVLSLATGGVHRYSLFYSVVCHFERCWLQLEELILWLTSGSWLLYHLLPPPDISSVSSAVSASGLLAGSLHFLFPLPDMLFLVSSHDCISYILRLLLKCSPEISSRNHPALGSSHPPYPALLFFIAMLSTWNIFTVCLPSWDITSLKSETVFFDCLFFFFLLLCPSNQNRHPVNICWINELTRPMTFLRFFVMVLSAEWFESSLVPLELLSL